MRSRFEEGLVDLNMVFRAAGLVSESGKFLARVVGPADYEELSSGMSKGLHLLGLDGALIGRLFSDFTSELIEPKLVII